VREWLANVAQDLSLVFCNAMEFNLEGAPIWESARGSLDQAHDDMSHMVKQQQQLQTHQSGYDESMVAPLLSGLHAHPPLAMLCSVG
jgi:hypothetical protein